MLRLIACYCCGQLIIICTQLTFYCHVLNFTWRQFEIISSYQSTKPLQTLCTLFVFLPPANSAVWPNDSMILTQECHSVEILCATHEHSFHYASNYNIIAENHLLDQWPLRAVPATGPQTWSDKNWSSTRSSTPATTLLPARAMKAGWLGMMVSVKAYWASKLRLHPVSTCSENLTAPPDHVLPRIVSRLCQPQKKKIERETGWNRRKTLPPSLADIDHYTLGQIS